MTNPYQFSHSVTFIFLSRLLKQSNYIKTNQNQIIFSEYVKPPILTVYHNIPMSSQANSHAQITSDHRMALRDTMGSDTPTSSSSSSRESSTSRPNQAQRPSVEALTPTYPKTNQSVDPLTQTFPRPSQDIDVESAIDRRPGRWSFKGQLLRNQEREKAQAEAARAEATAEKRRQDFEDAKNDLLKSF